MLPEPWCQFCRKRVPAQFVDGDWVPEHFEFDYDEWHSILLGLLTPYFMWPFIMHHSDKAGELVARETWYVVGGMLAHYFTVLTPVWIPLAWRLLWN